MRRRSARRSRVIAGLSLLVIASVTGCSFTSGDVTASPQPTVHGSLPAAVTDDMSERVAEAMAATASSGALVGVWSPGIGAWTEGFGVDGPDGGDVDADMTFRASSITRAMTCDVLWGLAADDVVDIDDPVSDWVPGDEHLGGVTLGALCDSTSGFGGYTPQIMGRILTNPTRVWNESELASYGVARGREGVPGQAYRSSDAGYILLGIALQNASGDTAAELFDRYVFDPLKLDHSTLSATASRNALAATRSQDADGQPQCDAFIDLTNLSPSVGFTAHGVTTTVEDLGRYVQALASGSRSYDDAARYAHPQPLDKDAPTWLTTSGGVIRAGSLIGQAGSFPGYLVSAFADEATGLAVVVVLNNSRASATAARALSWELAAIASKVPTADGVVESGMPWTREDMAAEVDAAGFCG